MRLVRAEVNQHRCLFLGEIEHPGLEDDVLVAAVGKLPHGSLRLLIDHPFQGAFAATDVVSRVDPDGVVVVLAVLKS